MNPIHIHLLLNHFPTVGFSVGLGLFLVALFIDNFELKRASLVIFFLIAAMSIVTYVSGSDASEALKGTPGISRAVIQEHETAALGALALMQTTGFFSWLGLWVSRRGSRVPNWNMAVVLILAVMTFADMARAANMGGDIRHPAIVSGAGSLVSATRDGGASTAPHGALSAARAWGKFVETHSWVWPACETLHFVGLSLLFGVVLLLDLRMIGVGKSLSFASVYQLLPLGMLGFSINLVTGMMFFVAEPQQYAGFLFFLKMSLVLAGAVNVLYFMLCSEPWRVGEKDDARISTKLVAASTIVIWIAVLFCGHMLPWLGNSF